MIFTQRTSSVTDICPYGTLVFGLSDFGFLSHLGNSSGFNTEKGIKGKAPLMADSYRLNIGIHEQTRGYIKSKRTNHQRREKT